jgi:transposase
MGIVGGFDVHRAQITFEYLDQEDGGVRRGQIRPATREDLRAWLTPFRGVPDVSFALEATTGWRFVVEELERVGIATHLAEPADTRALRGPKRRAKTDRADAHHLRTLLQDGRLPESWIPPPHISELRTTVRLRHSLVQQRTAWLQRIQALLFHHGQPTVRHLLTAEHRAWLDRVELTPAAREALLVALRMVDHIGEELGPLERDLTAFARRQPGCRALMAHYGVGPCIAPVILAELGDPRRFSSSRHAVRYAGLDITVYASDDHRAAGRLSRQGPPILRWALYEAAKVAAREPSPDHRSYLDAKARLGGNRATLVIARRLLRRCYHTLRDLGDLALAPAEPDPEQDAA